MYHNFFYGIHKTLFGSVVGGATGACSQIIGIFGKSLATLSSDDNYRVSRISFFGLHKIHRKIEYEELKKTIVKLDMAETQIPTKNRRKSKHLHQHFLMLKWSNIEIQ
ncbi:unnamed protein product [Rotaria sordida]|uniref:Uncharacterized protein n=1 Tax=Rotaria sordida TaxID=392033 RepID=A0A819I964_9BILA|nr:unnamed protein product [Rotaria sordida]CAF3952159.1 unnamed protein product [Rotaria sordida]